MTDPLTEAVARIIDPSSWAVMDSYLADMLRKYKGENAAYDPEQYKHKESMDVAQAAIAAMRPASGELAALREALTPSGDTKAAYMGEFRFPFPVFNEDGEEIVMTPNVPWTTIKEIMAAIRNRAALRQAGEG